MAFNSCHRKLLLVATGAALLGTDLALAQQPQLEEVVVTARKREENLQDVPLSVTAIDAEQIERLGIRDLKDVTRYTPGVTLDQGFGLNDTRLVIRGLSPSRGRPNNAILVDGIDLTTESVSSPGGSILFNQRLLDVEQVEVVKGPQSALYGRAAFSGAISYRTRDPGEELEGEVSVDIGEYGRRYLRFGVGGPVTESFGLRVSGLGWNEDGYYRESFTGEDVGGGKGAGISLVGKWDATDTFAARFRIAYSDDEFDQQATSYNPVNKFITPPQSAIDAGVIANENAIVGLFAGSPEGASGKSPLLTPNPGRLTDVGDNPDNLPAPEDRAPYAGGRAEVLNTSLKLDWELGPGTLTSYTGYAQADSGQVFDGDFDARPNADNSEDIARGGLEIDFETDTKLFSQELRYTSALDGPVQFTVGALYWDESVDQVELGLTALAFPFGSSPTNYFNDVAPITNRIPNEVSRDTRSTSLYGLLEWSINDQWRLSLENRWAREEMKVRGSGCDPDQPPATFFCGFSTPDLAVEFPFGSGNISQLERIYTVDSTSHTYIAPKGIVEWIPSDDLLTYFSVSQGVKPGGIATVASGTWMDQFPPDGNFDELKFDDEKLIAYELGAKSTLLDRRLILNGTLFHQDYSDKQVPIQFFSGGFPFQRVENAGEAEVTGIELETVWLMTANTRLQIGYTWMDAEYTDLVYETNSTNSIARAGNCTPNADNNICAIDLSGQRMEDVPRNSAVAIVGWYPPLGGGGLNGLLEGDVQYEDRRYADEFNVREVEAYSLVNLRIGLQAESWDALVFVNNVFDDDTIRTWSGSVGIVATAERTNPDLAAFPAEGFSILPPPRQWGMRASFRF